MKTRSTGIARRSLALFVGLCATAATSTHAQLNDGMTTLQAYQIVFNRRVVGRVVVVGCDNEAPPPGYAAGREYWSWTRGPEWRGAFTLEPIEAVPSYDAYRWTTFPHEHFDLSRTVPMPAISPAAADSFYQVSVRHGSRWVPQGWMWLRNGPVPTQEWYGLNLTSDLVGDGAAIRFSERRAAHARGGGRVPPRQMSRSRGIARRSLALFVGLCATAATSTHAQLNDGMAASRRIRSSSTAESSAGWSWSDATTRRRPRATPPARSTGAGTPAPNGVAPSRSSPSKRSRATTPTAGRRFPTSTSIFRAPCPMPATPVTGRLVLPGQSAPPRVALDPSGWMWPGRPGAHAGVVRAEPHVGSGLGDGAAITLHEAQAAATLGVAVAACSTIWPSGGRPRSAPPGDSVPVVLRLVRPFHRHADVVGLLLASASSASRRACRGAAAPPSRPGAWAARRPSSRTCSLFVASSICAIAWLVKLLRITKLGWPVAQPRFSSRPSARISTLCPSGNVHMSYCGLMFVFLMPWTFFSPAMSISLSKWPMLPTIALSFIFAMCSAVMML